MNAPVLVLGATGVIGRGIVRAAVEAARPVIAVARNPAELARLRARHAYADVTVVTGSVASDSDGAELALALRALGRPLAGVVVAVSGGAGRGRLLDHAVEALQHQLTEGLLPHLAAARHLLPLLSEADRGGSYVLIGGPGSNLPWSGYGYRSVAAAAQRMLACVLHDEARALGVRVQLLSVDKPVCGESGRTTQCAQWPTAVSIGRRALALIARTHVQPACPVIRHAAIADHILDVDFAPLASTTRCASEKNLTTADPLMHTAHDPDINPSLLPARCLQDARELLKTLTHPKPLQEGPLQ